MMLSDRERQIAFPEPEQPVAIFFAVLINAEVNTRCQCINILRNAAVRVKRFGIRQIIRQANKLGGHFISVGSTALLNGFPTFLVRFYKGSLAQTDGLLCL